MVLESFVSLIPLVIGHLISRSRSQAGGFGITGYISLFGVATRSGIMLVSHAST